MKLTIIFVNYKCDKIKFQNCLNSIKIDTEIIVVDHSHDFTLDNLVVPNNLHIRIIKNDNLGNGAGINCGIKNSNTRYVLYLDIDTILSDNFFSNLEYAAKRIKDFAVLSPKLDGYYNDKKMNTTGNLSIIKFYYNKIFYKINIKKNKHKNIKQVFWVCGAIMLIDKNNTYKKDIKFDENIFIFFEEDDFFHQCFKLGQKIYLINDLYAKHFDGSVNDKSLDYECFKKWHWEKSKFYFLNKHYNSVFILLISMKNITKYSIKIIFFLFF